MRITKQPIPATTSWDLKDSFSRRSLMTEKMDFPASRAALWNKHPFSHKEKRVQKIWKKGNGGSLGLTERSLRFDLSTFSF